MNTISVTLKVSDSITYDPVEQEHVLAQVRGYLAWFLQTECKDYEYNLRSATGEPIGELIVRSA